MRIKYLNNFAMVLLLIIFISGLQANDLKYELYADQENILDKGAEYFIDENDSLSLFEIINSTPFIRINGAINFGFSKNVYWLRYNITDVNDFHNWLVEIGYPLLDSIEIYYPDQNGKYLSKISGDTFPFKNRDLIYKNVVFEIPIYVHSTDIYLKIKSESSMKVPISVWSAKEFSQKVNKEIFAYGIFFGIMLVMLIYNLFLFSSIKEISYLYYCFFIASAILAAMSLYGFAFEYLWPNSPWWANHSTPFMISIMFFFAIMFARNFLNIRNLQPSIDRVMLAFQFILSLVMIISLVSTYTLSIKLATLFGSLSCLIIIISSIRIYIMDFKPARFFLAAWSLSMVGMFIYGLLGFGLLPINFFTNHSPQFGMIMEVILLSLALADRINLLKREKENTQKKALEAQRLMTTSFARFVPKQILYFLDKKDITEVNLGDSTQREMSILFSDIRSFTSLSEGMTPDENFGFINSYMAVMGPCIRNNNGFIDKYIGDAIMALFPENPSDAIDASIEMLEELHKLNLKRKEKGYPIISIGIGIHTGNQMLGIIGENERLEGTVISDVVNTASRLEGLTKIYSSSILVSRDVMDKIDNVEKYKVRHLDTVKVKGKNKAVDILEILNGNSKRIIELKIKLRPIFEEGIEYYNKKDFDKAIEIFNRVLKEDPKDKASEIYIERCNFYIKNGVDNDWDGIEKLNFK